MIKYPTFTKLYAQDNSETSINLQLLDVTNKSSITMHVINELTNQSITDINKLYNNKIVEDYAASTSISQSEVGLLLQNPTIIVKFEFIKFTQTSQYIKEFDLSSAIGKSVSSKIIFANLRDSLGQGINWEEFDQIASASTFLTITIKMQDSIKYKTKRLSVFIKETSNSFITEEPALGIGNMTIGTTCIVGKDEELPA